MNSPAIGSCVSVSGKRPAEDLAPSHQSPPKRQRGRPKKGVGSSKPVPLRPPLRSSRNARSSSSTGSPSRQFRVLPHRETCSTKDLPDHLRCSNCMAARDPIGAGVDLFSADKENLPCLQLWLPGKNRSLAQEQTHQLTLLFLGNKKRPPPPRQKDHAWR